MKKVLCHQLTHQHCLLWGRKHRQGKMNVVLQPCKRKFRFESSFLTTLFLIKLSPFCTTKYRRSDSLIRPAWDWTRVFRMLVGPSNHWARTSCRGLVVPWAEHPTSIWKTLARSPVGLRCVFRLIQLSVPVCRSHLTVCEQSKRHG